MIICAGSIFTDYISRINKFPKKPIKVLSRGIDIKEIGLVINYEVPHDAEDYVHRIGRTARADRKGEAITFITQKDVSNFMEIEKLIKKEVPKLDLPKGFGTALEYKKPITNKKKKYWNTKK